jgi:LmbE family N-acetylglucosaminyl deacetylase
VAAIIFGLPVGGTAATGHPVHPGNAVRPTHPARLPRPAHPAHPADSIRVLLVTAHPDDDAMFAGTVYKLTHALGGVVDLAVVTDGAGGFRYAQLAEPIYGLELTDERVARAHLPAIRKRELMAGGAIVGIRNYFFLDERDDAYTENADSVLRFVWNAARVRGRLAEIMARGAYDFVFAHLPVLRFHGHHQAATILALEAAGDLPESARPIVLGSFVGVEQGDTTHLGFTGTRVTRSLASAPACRHSCSIYGSRSIRPAGWTTASW